MKKYIIVLLLSPLFSFAQQSLPRFENDTLYMTNGYKIYKGQVLQLANGTLDAGYFRFIKFQPGTGRTDTYTLQNSSILVTRLRNYKNSGLDNHSIRIIGDVSYKNGDKTVVDILMDFERASENFAGLSSELIIPAGYQRQTASTVLTEVKKQPKAVEKNRETDPADLKKLMVADEIKKLFELYKVGALSKEEYENQKKKLLDRQ